MGALPTDDLGRCGISLRAGNLLTTLTVTTRRARLASSARSPESVGEDAVSEHLPSDVDPDPAEEPEMVEEPEPFRAFGAGRGAAHTAPLGAVGGVGESPSRAGAEPDEDEDEANLMFSLPDLPQREGDLRPVDPIAAFDEEFSTTSADRASDLFGDRDAEPAPWDQPVEADDPEPASPAADPDEPPLFSAFSPATEPAPPAGTDLPAAACGPVAAAGVRSRAVVPSRVGSARTALPGDAGRAAQHHQRLLPHRRSRIPPDHPPR